MLYIPSSIEQAKEELVELSNGCICCTLRADLLREVTRPAKTGAFDYLLIESTGVSEPMQVISQSISYPNKENGTKKLLHHLACMAPCMSCQLPHQLLEHEVL